LLVITLFSLINLNFLVFGQKITLNNNFELMASKNLGDFQYVPGEVIVKFKDKINIKLEANVDSFSAINKKYGASDFELFCKEKYLDAFRSLYKIKYKSPDLTEIVNELRELSIVEYAELNYIYEASMLPNDNYFDQQWSLNQSNDHDIDAPAAWDIETGSSSITIAIVDTGIDYNHPDLIKNNWINVGEVPSNGIDDDNNGYIDDVFGWNFKNQNNNPIDRDGHGTHCAGIASAVANNGIGIAGVCWSTKLMSISCNFNIWKLSKGITYATENNADIISMSWGGNNPSDTLKDVIKYAFLKNVVLIAASGNKNNSDFFYPAAYYGVISVSSTNKNDQRADFSNYGLWVDLSAPGEDIYSTYLEYSYKNLSGTSASAAIVSGVVGLMLSVKPRQSNLAIKNILCSTADEINTDENIGGRVNAFRAVREVKDKIVFKSFIPGLIIDFIKCMLHKKL